MSTPIDPRPLDIGRLGAGAPARRAPQPAQPPDGSFGDALSREVARRRGIEFSNHAQTRLSQRNLTIEGEALARVEAAFDKLGTKGARSSLILLDDLALLANVPGRKVITAIDTRQAKEQVFTNIDSAVIA